MWANLLSGFGVRGTWRSTVRRGLAIAILTNAGWNSAFGQSADAPVAAPVPAAHVRYQLAYRFSPGQRVAYQSVHTMTLTTQKGQLAETVRNEARVHKHFEVVSVADGGSAVLELTLDHVQMSAQFGDSPAVSLDSAKPDDAAPAYRGVMKTIGKPLARVRFSSAGELLGSESLLDREVEARVSGPPSVKHNEGDAGKHILVPLPGAPQAVGATWTDSDTIPVFVTRTLTQDVKVLRKYRLEAVENGVARISVKSVVITPLRDPAIDAQLIQREPSGTIEFDLERGLLLSRTVTVDKTVLAPFGGDTSMHAESVLTETLVDGDRIAQHPAK
jgi:hypothetical protein